MARQTSYMMYFQSLFLCKTYLFNFHSNIMFFFSPIYITVYIYLENELNEDINLNLQWIWEKDYSDLVYIFPYNKILDKNGTVDKMMNVRNEQTGIFPWCINQHYKNNGCIWYNARTTLSIIFLKTYSSLLIFHS